MPHKTNLTPTSLSVSVELIERRIYLIRGQKRFPEDFMFRLTKEEAESLKSQSVISNPNGGRRYLPYDFRVVFDELKKLTNKPLSSGRQIGFKRRS